MRWSHFGLDLHFLITIWCQESFHLFQPFLFLFYFILFLFQPFLYLHWRKVYSNLFWIGLFVLFCPSSLYFMPVKSLPDIWFINIFSHSFHFLCTVLWWTKVLDFDEVHSTHVCYCYSYLKIHCQIWNHEDLPLYFF